jgi:hypothetical protein
VTCSDLFKSEEDEPTRVLVEAENGGSVPSPATVEIEISESEVGNDAILFSTQISHFSYITETRKVYSLNPYKVHGTVTVGTNPGPDRNVVGADGRVSIGYFITPLNPEIDTGMHVAWLPQEVECVASPSQAYNCGDDKLKYLMEGFCFKFFKGRLPDYGGHLSLGQGETVHNQ